MSWMVSICEELEGREKVLSAPCDAHAVVLALLFIYLGIARRAIWKMHRIAEQLILGNAS